MRRVLDVLTGFVLCDVLRRCHWRGCYRRQWGRTVLMGRLCEKHWNEWYSPLPGDTEEQA